MSAGFLQTLSEKEGMELQATELEGADMRGRLQQPLSPWCQELLRNMEGLAIHQRKHRETKGSGQGRTAMDRVT